MTLFDSHAHFPRASSVEHADQVDRARVAGLCGLLAVGGGPDLDDGAVAMAQRFPDYVHLALGYDRDCALRVALTSSGLLASMQALRARVRTLSDAGVPLVAVGETGLDFSREPSAAERAAQQALFAEHLLLAAELGVPCTIHSRDAADETLALIERYGSPVLRAAGRLGVIHCFTGDATFAAGALSLGLMISASGILTFRQADALRTTFSVLPLDRLLVETDCPYLTPVPLRGRVNEPALVVHTVRTLADVLGVEPEVCATATTANARRLFALGE